MNHHPLGLVYNAKAATYPRDCHQRHAAVKLPAGIVIIREAPLELLVDRGQQLGQRVARLAEELEARVLVAARA